MFTTMALGMATYTYYLLKRRISITSGKYFTEGEVTYSEHSMFAGRLNGDYESLVTYKYYINGQLFTGLLNKKNLFSRNQYKHLVEKYPPGTKERIYYSVNEPNYSRIGKYPSKLVLISKTVLINLLMLYVFMLFVGFWLWVFAQAPAK